MKKYITGLSILAATLAIILPSAQAHHGPGQFNGGDVEVTGVLTNVRFVNPHAYIYFDAKDESGETEAWRCELQAGSLLRRAGWTTDLFPVGGEITVTGSAGTNERTACALATVTLPDGTTLDRYGQLTDDVDQAVGSVDRIVDGKLDLNGTWAAPQRAIEAAAAGGEGGMGGGMGPGGMGPGGPVGGGIRLPNGITALTDAGTAAAATLTPGYNPRQNCQATSIFFDWTFDRHVNEIIQTDDTITLKYGLMDIVRTIHMNMDEHPDNIELSVAGHSIGQWEGTTLVVDSVGFAPNSYLFGTSIVTSEQAHVVEKFTYNSENQELTREYTAVDPLMVVGTLTGQDAVFPSNVPFEAYDCVELKDDYIEPI
jgi:hypothetical protein